MSFVGLNKNNNLTEVVKTTSVTNLCFPVSANDVYAFQAAKLKRPEVLACIGLRSRLQSQLNFVRDTINRKYDITNGGNLSFVSGVGLRANAFQTNGVALRSTNIQRWSGSGSITASVNVRADFLRISQELISTPAVQGTASNSTKGFRVVVESGGQVRSYIVRLRVA